MLAIRLFKNFRYSTHSGRYNRTLSHLAENTIISYRNTEWRPRGLLASSFDASQVCCWMCEKPLVNDMRLGTRKDSSGKIKIIRSPVQDGDIPQEYSEQEVPINQAGELKDTLLICGDCHEGLSSSLSDPELMIYDAEGNEITGEQKYNPEHYIWPQEKEAGYSSGDCFSYQKEFAFVVRFPHSREEHALDESDEANGATTFIEQHVMVEPSANLPSDVYRKARNTIRLFRLNGKHYQYKGQDHHLIKYYAGEGQSPVDDLRRQSRNKAHDRAREALIQFRNVREMYAGPEMMNILRTQQHILMELNGHRSVWDNVFHDGGDPGGFNDIMGIVAPVSPKIPVAPVEEMEVEEIGERPQLGKKRTPVYVENPNQFFQQYLEIVQRCSGMEQVPFKRPRYDDVENTRKLYVEKAKRSAFHPGYQKLLFEKNSPEDMQVESIFGQSGVSSPFSSLAFPVFGKAY